MWKSGRISSTERSAIINMGLKPVSLVLSLIYTPILLGYLGDEKYGLWATILSVITWMSFFDVGIGNGLRNLLSKLIAEDNENEGKKAISTAYIILSIISILLFCILAVLALFADWNYFFSTNISLNMVLLVTFLFICINFVLSLSNSILYALNKAEMVSIRNCLVQVANIIGLIILRQFSKENLIVIAILFGATSAFFYIEASVHVFIKYPRLMPSIKFFDKRMIKEISSVGVKFFVIQIMGLLLFTVDNMLITHYFGAVNATPFSITNKVFNTMYAVFAAFIVPYWSRTTVAYNQGDVEWIKKSIRKVFLVGMAFIAGYFIMIFAFTPMIHLWLQRDLNNPNGLVILMAIFYSLYTLLGAECQFINGMGFINVQLITYIAIGVMNIPLSIFLGVHLNMGSFGVRLATTVLVALAVIILAINLRKTVSKVEKKNIIYS